MADDHSGVTIEQQIRWGDLDALGHVNNIVFFQFAESGRMAYFETLKITDFKEAPLDGPGMVSAQLNFRRQLKYPGTVRVTTHVIRIGEKSFTMHYTLRDTIDDFIVADGESIMVWVDYAISRAKPLSMEFIERVIEIEKNPNLRSMSKNQ